jgi:hypothetical protein
VLTVVAIALQSFDDRNDCAIHSRLPRAVVSSDSPEGRWSTTHSARLEVARGRWLPVGDVVGEVGGGGEGGDEVEAGEVVDAGWVGGGGPLRKARQVSSGARLCGSREAMYQPGSRSGLDRYRGL